MEEKGDGGNVGVAVGTETLIKGARDDVTQGQHRNVIVFDRIFHFCRVAIVFMLLLPKMRNIATITVKESVKCEGNIENEEYSEYKLKKKANTDERDYFY